MRLEISRRLWLEGPDLDPHLPWKGVLAGHSSDEYGNCSVYFRTKLFGIVFFWDPHFQRKVEVPDPYLPFGEDHKALADRWYEWYQAKFE